MRASDFWLDVDDTYIDLDTLRALRAAPSPEHSDLEVALGLVELLHDQFLKFGTSGGQSLDDSQAREAVRTLEAVLKRLGLDWTLPFRDMTSFRSYWLRNDAHRSWEARRQLLAPLFEPLRDQLEGIEDRSLAGELASPVSPRGRTGWERVDVEVAELRRHFHTARTPQDYRNIGNDVVAVLEALSAAAYDPARHLRAGELEPGPEKTKNRLARIVEVDGGAEGSEELTRLAKATVDFAQAVKHNPGGTRRKAGLAADAVIQLVNLVRRLQET